ncbi:uncharacterized protein AB675_10474 [Cyphellophora attinorum]|uniref:MYND-type domain-containing protein n=1 Tax=Cyphellophora attinorum TaxID=1664694 RepID=A0A0N0NIP4_9EURO|nr:uncharacterized protein AB675_10474 [Phialophora attinorum]KPI35978.1 hypothetical protein AB675_10474 [Phialophora attinorum]
MTDPKRLIIPAKITESKSFEGGRREALSNHCLVCDAEGKLSRCSACRVGRYCSREHQLQDRERHKLGCRDIKVLRAQLQVDDHDLRNTTDPTTSANAFDLDVGRFWEFEMTRQYICTRFMVADLCRLAGTLDGTVEAIEHMQDMLRLCDSDHLDLRYAIPPMMLQLDRDQECYNFIKWWQTRHIDDNGQEHEMYHPDVCSRPANPLESIAWLDHDNVDVEHLGAMLLLKLKLLIDVIALKRARKVIEHRLDVELWTYVDRHVVRSKLSTEWSSKSYKELTAVQQRLEQHAIFIGGLLSKITKHFPAALLDPDRYLKISVETKTRGSIEETVFLLHSSYGAWWNHEGVLELLQNALFLAAVKSKAESKTWLPAVEQMMAGQAISNVPFLKVKNINKKMWQCLPEAVDTAFDLNQLPTFPMLRNWEK